MKTEKILSITMINAFVLMMFGSFLSGCQKTSIPTSGFYSQIKSNGRTPASSNEYIQYQDPKQIYIYCHLNELDAKKCYELQSKMKIQELSKKHKSLTEIDIPSYENVHNEVQVINKKLIQNIKPEINKILSHRENYCEKNSKYYLDRCLNQYISKETIELVNKIQNNNSPLNGREYLYLQKQIEKDYKAQLEIAKDNIIQRKKKAL